MRLRFRSRMSFCSILTGACVLCSLASAKRGPYDDVLFRANKEGMVTGNESNRINRIVRYGDFDSIAERTLAVLSGGLAAFDHQLHGLAVDRGDEHCACRRPASERSASGVAGGP